MPSWYNLFLATFGVVALLRFVDTERRRWLFVAGLMGGLSVLIKVIGLYFVGAAMLFVVFDVEVIFLYPWAVVFRRLGVFGLVQMGIFVGLILIAYIYDWKRGGLEWD